MPQYVDDSYDDDDYIGDPNESSVLREVRKALRAAEKRNKELEAEVGQFRTQTRQQSLQQSLEARGLNPKIAAFVPDSLTSGEEISKWLDEYGDVFGPPQQREQDASQSQADGAVPPGYEQVQQTVASGAAPTGDESQLAALIAGAKTPKELNQILFGNPNGPQLS
jgi:hypothetical protein